MKLKKGFIVSKIDNDYIAVAADEAGKSFSGMLKMNSTAAFIAEALKEETDEDTLVMKLCDKYDVSKQLAHDSVIATIESLRKCGLLEE